MTNRLRSAGSVVILSLLLLALSSFAHAQDETARKLESLEVRFSQSLVQVRYRQQVSVSTAEPPDEGELTTVTKTGNITTTQDVPTVSCS